MTDIITQIVSGQADSILDAVAKAVNERYKILDEAKLKNLAIGDAVFLRDDIRPTYLQGLLAEVIGFKTARNGSTVVRIRLDDGPVGRFRSGTLVCGVALIKKVSYVP